MKQLDFLDALNEIPEEFRDELTQWQKAGTPLSEEIPEQHTAEDAEPVVPVKEEIVMKTQKDREIPTKWLKPVTIGVFASIAACLAAVIYFGGKASQKDQQPDRTPAAQISEQTEATTPIVQTVVMPEVIGLDHHQATEAMGLAGYRGGSQDSISCKIVEQDMPDLPPGVVIACDPPVGETIPEGKEATLTVVARRSFEGESESVVWFLDTEYDKFCKYADQMGVGIRKHEVPNDHPEEHDGKAAYVTSYWISKADVESGSCYVMNVTVATENVQDDSIRLPELKGRDYQQAANIAQVLGLNYDRQYEDSTTVADGTVLRVEADTPLHSGDTVRIVVAKNSSGQNLVVPALNSLSAEMAKKVAEGLGFIIEFNPDDFGGASSDNVNLDGYVVVSQSIAPGEAVAAGTTIQLNVRKTELDRGILKDVQSVKISTPVLVERNEPWITISDIDAGLYLTRISNFKTDAAEQSAFDFTGGGMLLRIQKKNGDETVYELFEDGLIKLTKKESGSQNSEVEYLKERTGEAMNLLKMIQDEIIKKYPQ